MEPRLGNLDLAAREREARPIDRGACRLLLAHSLALGAFLPACFLSV